MPQRGEDAGRPAAVREHDPVDGGSPRAAAARRGLPLHAPRLAVPAGAADPDRRRAGADPRRGDGRLRRLGAGDHPHRGADGAGDRGAGGPLRARHRRPAQRHLRQRAGADHRPLRPQPGAAGGGQGLDRRLDPRQHPAGPRRGDAGRRPRPRQADLQPHRRQRPEHDADARRRGAADAGDLRAGRGPGAAGAGRRVGQLRLDGRAPLAGGRDRPHRHLRDRSLLLAEDPPGDLQPRVRGGGHLGLVDPDLGDRAGDRRACWSG